MNPGTASDIIVMITMLIMIIMIVTVVIFDSVVMSNDVDLVGEARGGAPGAAADPRRGQGMSPRHSLGHQRHDRHAHHAHRRRHHRRHEQ